MNVRADLIEAGFNELVEAVEDAHDLGHHDRLPLWHPERAGCWLCTPDVVLS